MKPGPPARRPRTGSSLRLLRKLRVMRVVILLLNYGRGSGEIARQHAKELVRIGHGVWYMHPFVGDGVEGAHNLDVQLHVDVLPVHEYLPVAGRDQLPVSNMDAAEALAYVPDYEAAL